ncbi:MAG: isochorismatase family cysteine hydrolase [Wujia sp.]|nr:isochorismatase family cysteine hydrolase [Wujia sp.]MDD7283583.1 cysteine hydrolase [Clostridium sp.]MDY3726924.1 isochorismatase family cysteine hydrolase [Wujia sp.]
MRNILIVVDMQKDFVTGALASAEAQAILPKVKEKIEVYDRAGKEIIFTRDTHGEDYMQTNEGKHLPVPHCIKGTDGWQICAELTDGITSEYKTVDKPTFGFLGWKDVLASETADGSDLDIEMIGVCTDICVVSNTLILKALYPEATVRVDAGCCAGVTPEAHAAALVTMRACQVDVTDK